MTDTQSLLFQFIEHLKVLNRTAVTIKDYSGHVRLFLAWLTKDIKGVTRADMESYIATLYDYRKDDGKGYSTNTIIIKVRSLKRFFEFLEQANIIFINPMEYIQEPKIDRALPRNILTTKEMGKFLDQANLGTKIGIRDRAVLEVLYSTGIRVNELSRLTIYDADLQGKMVRINKGKGRKDRVVPLGKHAVRFLREYISKIRPHFTKKNRKSRVLFVNQLGNPLSSQILLIIVRKYAKAAKIKKKVTPHTFRHTFASQLVKNGADIVAVQKMLGHENLDTTQIYIKGLNLNLKKAHSKSHPREKDKVDRKSIKPQIERVRPHYGTQP